MPSVRMAAGVGSSDTAESPGRPTAIARKVGAEYTIQVVRNSLPLLLADIVSLTAIIAGCRMVFVYLGFTLRMDVSDYLLPLVSGFVLLNIELALYPGVRLSPVEEFRRLIVSVSAVFVMWALAVAFLAGGLTEQPLFLLGVYACSLVGIPICHASARRILGSWKCWPFPALICGNDSSTLKLYDWISANPRLGLRPVAVVADPGALQVEAGDTTPVIPWSAAQEVAVEKKVYWAVVVPPEGGTAAMSQLIAEYLAVIPHIHVLSELTGLPTRGNAHQHIDGLTGVHLQQNLMLPSQRLIKRLLDVVAALIGTLILLPLLFYIAVAVKLSSRGPILYGHERIGRGGRRFRAWKFRTMFVNASQLLDLYLEMHPELQSEWDKDHKLRYDPRVTRIGRFLRLTSLDELPQLWNVIRGQMSLVGPRPIVTAEIPKYGAYYGLYTLVTPGITGLWQVSGRNDTTYDERVQLDAYYVQNWSPWLDMYLLIRTIRIVLFARGAY